jgi:DNA primase catalytic core
MTPTNEVDLILQKVNIADVIGRYIEVQKKGNSYVAVCPFHDDSSPSLSISVDKKIFKCFPCGVGGNAITFVQKFKSLSFQEALAEVGKTVGVDIKVFSKSKPKYSSMQERIISINEDAMDYFSTMLFTKEGKAARNYLQGRKISLKEVRTYNIGFAKSKYDLYDYLHNTKKYSLKEIEESVLFRKKGLTMLPTFFNRLIFPIRDFEGKVIGFSGRVLEKTDSVPKYLNTSENLVFKKSHLAYNFSNAESAIRVRDEIILLEGYMDVISLNRIEIKNAIAIMGTSLSEFQIKEFKKLTSNFTIFLDGDAPGVAATIKLIKQLYFYNVNVKVVINETENDPDELIQSGNKNKVLEMLERKKIPVEFAISVASKKIEANDSFETKNEVSKIVYEILQLEKAETTKSWAIKSFAELLKVSEQSVQAEFEKFCNENILKENISKENKNSEVPTKKFVVDDFELMADEFEVMSYSDSNSEFIMNTDDAFVGEEVYIEKQLTTHNKSDLTLKRKTPAYHQACSVIILGILYNNEFILNNRTIVATVDEKTSSLLETLFDIKSEHPEFTKEEILNELGLDKNKNKMKTLKEIFNSRNNIFEINSPKPSMKLVSDAFKEILKTNKNIGVQDFCMKILKLAQQIDNIYRENISEEEKTNKTKMLIETMEAVTKSKDELIAKKEI